MTKQAFQKSTRLQKIVAIIEKQMMIAVDPERKAELYKEKEKARKEIQELRYQ